MWKQKRWKFSTALQNITCGIVLNIGSIVCSCVSTQKGTILKVIIVDFLNLLNRKSYKHSLPPPLCSFLFSLQLQILLWNMNWCCCCIAFIFILKLTDYHGFCQKNKFMFTSIYVKFLLFNLLCMFRKTTVVLITESSIPVNWVGGLHNFIGIVSYIVRGIWKCDRTMDLMFPVVQAYQIFHVPH